MQHICLGMFALYFFITSPLERPAWQKVVRQIAIHRKLDLHRDKKKKTELTFVGILKIFILKVSLVDKNKIVFRSNEPGIKKNRIFCKDTRWGWTLSVWSQTRIPFVWFHSLATIGVPESWEWCNLYGALSKDDSRLALKRTQHT